MRTRTEVDFLGPVQLDANCLYGVHTLRALQNFGATSRPFAHHREFVSALAWIKAAAACANADLDLLDRRVADSIVQACAELRDGRFTEYLAVDALEGSGGTSINMNVNEVIANRALQMLGYEPGDYGVVHPNDDVNRSQSTNDVIPTALGMALYAVLEYVIAEVENLGVAFAHASVAFKDDLRLGRTCLQDAQPMSLGSAFGAYATAIRRQASELVRQRDALLQLPIGATAIGTGLGAPPRYRDLVLQHLRSQTGADWVGCADLFDGLANADKWARLSGELRCVAGTLGKIGADFQFLSSGPAGGVAELRLPAVQAGSSIMPGKVNPVIPMYVCQLGFVVAGFDAGIAAACQHGQLEINPYEPAIGDSLLTVAKLVGKSAEKLRTLCVEAIEPNRERQQEHVLNSSAVATAFVERLGYDRVSEIVRRAESHKKSFIVQLIEEGIATRDECLAVLRSSARASAQPE